MGTPSGIYAFYVLEKGDANCIGRFLVRNNAIVYFYVYEWALLRRLFPPGTINTQTSARVTKYLMGNGVAYLKLEVFGI